MSGRIKVVSPDGSTTPPLTTCHVSKLWHSPCEQIVTKVVILALLIKLSDKVMQQD